MVSLVCAFLLAGSPAQEKKDASRSLYLWDRKTVKVRSFDLLKSTDRARLKKTNADLIVVRMERWDANAASFYRQWKTGPKGARRVVLLEFPALSARPDNGVMWRRDWDMDSNGKPDEDAPSWLRERNANGDYLIDTTDPTYRTVMVGKNGMVAKIARSGFDGFVFNTATSTPDRPGIDAKLISDVVSEARTARPGFLAFVRNPGKLSDYAAIRSNMDGFIVDGFFYGAERPNVESSEAFLEEFGRNLNWMVKWQRLVMSIAYTTDAKQIKENRRRAAERGFLPLELAKRG